MSTFRSAREYFEIQERRRKESEEKLKYYNENKDLDFEKIKDTYRADWEAHKPFVVETNTFYSVKQDIKKTVKHLKLLNILTKEVK